MVPVYKCDECLGHMYERLVAAVSGTTSSFELVFVDDRSPDDSWSTLSELAREDARVRLVRLSRNFGQHAAITAGLEHARGQAMVIMDADLQDPPEVVPEMAKQWRAGNEVVYGVRDSRDGESRTKLATARWFYRLLRPLSDIDIPVDAGDFRLVDRTVVDAVLSMPERRRYLRGMFAWVGYDQVGVHYARAARERGATKFSTRRMLRFASDGIVSFSTAPLRFTLMIGFAMSALAFVAAFVGVVVKVADLYTVPGWASIVVGVSILGGLQLMVLGTMGEYVARIYDEVRRRPLYLVREQLGDDR